MDTFTKAIGGFFIAGMFIFISPCIGVLFGAFCGWVVSIMAPIWVPNGLAIIGIKVDANHLVELGAALGFLGGFFRITRSSEK